MTDDSSTIKSQLIAMLDDDKQRLADEFGRPMVNPFTGESDFWLPDPYPPPVANSEVAAFSERAGLKLPEDVVEWLRISNGPPGFFGLDATNPSNNIEKLLSTKSEWLLRNWIPVGRDTSGNFFVKVMGPTPESSPVCFVEGTDGTVLEYAIASDVLHFALFRLEQKEKLNAGVEYAWPFDRQFVLNKDPALGRVSSASLPWDDEAQERF